MTTSLSRQNSGAANAASSPGGAASSSSSELTDWVNTIAARATVAAGYSTQSASALQDEVRRAREERQNRRDRLSATGVRGVTLSRGNSETGPHGLVAGSDGNTTGESFASGGILSPLSPSLTGGNFGTTIDGKPFDRESILCRSAIEMMCSSFGLIAASLDIQATQAPAFPTHSIPKSPTLHRTSGSFSSATTPFMTATPRSGTNESVPIGSGGATSTRGAALLARYGGAAGPTGHLLASSSPGSGGSDKPVALANFMGGRASGPRLGKLAGDGRSQPPEAALAYSPTERDSRGRPIGVALPGLTGGSPGGGLASFMKVHLPPGQSAGSSGIGTAARSKSPEKPSPSTLSTASQATLKRSSGTFAPSPVTDSSASPSAPTGASAGSGMSFPRPLSMQRSGSGLSTTGMGTNSANLLSTSPSRASPGTAYGGSSFGAGKRMSWSERGIPTSPSGALSKFDTAPKSPLKSPGLYSTSPSVAAKESSYFASAPRSPAKMHTAPLAGSTTGGLEAASPIKKSASPSPQKESVLLSSYATTSQSPLPAARSPSPEAPEVPAWKAALLANRGGSGSATNAGAKFGSNTSPAFATSHVERAPTASLTRLSAKKMVGQRIKEAKERQSDIPTSNSASDASNTLANSAPLKSRWPASVYSQPPPQADPSPIASAEPSTSPVRKIFSPGKFVNALPGLSGAPSAGGMRAYSKSPEKDVEVARPDAQPVRLPGMGGSSSPFANRPPSPTKFGGAAGVPLEKPVDEADDKESASTSAAATQPLSTLTKGRARGPKRTAQRTNPAETRASEIHADTATPLSDAQPAPTVRASAFMSSQQTSESASAASYSPARSQISNWDQQLESRSPWAETIKATGAPLSGAKRVSRPASPVKDQADSRNTIEGLPSSVGSSIPSSFRGELQPDADPTVSKLIGTERDTFHQPKPSGRLMEKTSPRPTVREVEKDLKQDAAKVVQGVTASFEPLRSTTGKKIVVLISGSGE